MNVKFSQQIFVPVMFPSWQDKADATNFAFIIDSRAMVKKSFTPEPNWNSSLLNDLNYLTTYPVASRPDFRVSFKPKFRFSLVVGDFFDALFSLDQTSYSMFR